MNARTSARCGVSRAAARRRAGACAAAPRRAARTQRRVQATDDGAHGTATRAEQRAREWYHRAARRARIGRSSRAMRRFRRAMHDLSAVPPAAVRARSRNRARRSPSRASTSRRRLGLAQRVRAARRRASPVTAMGLAFPESRRPRRRPRQERRAHRRPRGARLRLHRMRHRDAARAAGQSEAAPVPPARGARRSINRLGFNNDGVERFLANVGARVAGAASSASTSARTSTRRTSAPSTTTSPACAPSTRARRYVTVNISSPNTKGLRELQAEDALDGAARARSRREQATLADSARQVHAARGQDRARPRPRRDRRHRAAARRGTGSTASSRPTRRSRATASRACRTPTRRAACPGAPLRERGDRGRRARSRRRSTARCRSSASAASCRGADAKEKIDAGATLVQIYTGLIYRGPDLVAECVAARWPARMTATGGAHPRLQCIRAR